MHPNVIMMTRNRFKKVLLVAPEITHEQLITDFQQVKHICAIDRIFPAIFEESPNLIVFDYNYVGEDMENIVRRIRANNFYNKIKICCFKNKAHIKTDDFLKAIGVDFFIYQDEFKTAPVSSRVPALFNELLDRSIFRLLPNASN